MIPIELEEIAALELGRLEGDAPAAVVTAVKADSREVGRGELFVALNTGVRYVDEARARGAITLVPDDQDAALAALARLVRSRSSAQRGRGGRLHGQDVDEGHPRRALWPRTCRRSPPSEA